MSIPEAFAKRIARFPEGLRVLLDAELAAGNEIAEVAGGFPSPPAGDCVKLARPITTRARAKSEQIDYYDRNSSLYSGEWTDAQRFFFILEPPHPPEPEPDMDAIRARLGVRPVEPPRDRLTPAPHGAPDIASEKQGVAQPGAAPPSVVDRFQRSMVIDYKKWHDGIGYDVSLLKEASPVELQTIEGILLGRGTSDWRDIEALAMLKTPKAKKALKAAMTNGKTEVREAVLRHAPSLVSEDEKTEFLVEALRTAQFYGGLSQALDHVAGFHPPEILAELFRGALERKGEVAIHFAAMLMFIHGKAPEPFDWNQRPFFLRFETATHAEREAVFRELCGKIGANANAYLSTG